MLRKGNPVFVYPPSSPSVPAYTKIATELEGKRYKKNVPKNCIGGWGKTKSNMLNYRYLNPFQKM